MFRNLRFIYITTKDRNEAEEIAQVLVKEKLAACANIIDNMSSVYRWEGKVVTDRECVLIAKTTYSNVNALTKRVKEMHSYEVPCVVSLKISEQEGNPEYLNWLVNSVKPPLPASENLKNF